MGSMGKFLAAAAVFAIAALLIAAPASAFEGGGRKPSEAPPVVVGQPYSGQLNNHRDDTNYSGFAEVAFWRLPPLTTRDQVIVNWHAAPFTKSPGYFPICLILAQGIDDFSWGGVFEKRRSCSTEGPAFELSGSGTARSVITAQETTTNSSYLEFFAYANETNPASFETYPYDFTIEPILHYLAVAIQPVKRVSATGIIRATANLATGLPAPDGLPFNLAVTWPDGGIANYSVVSGGGVVGFQLALPETAYGKTATFEVSHPADGTYQGVMASKLQVKVAKPKAPAPTPCFLAERRQRSLTRQFKRLKRHASHASGVTRAILRRRAAHTKRKLRAARAQTKSACDPG
jgi:hypothetical protein